MEENLGKLEESVMQANVPYKTINDFIKKVAAVSFIVYYGGILKRNHQKRFAERLGWKEKDLTLRNAVYCGLVMSAVKYFGAEGVGIVENFDTIKGIENYVVSGMASLLGTTAKNFLYGYSAFDVTQSAFRIAYSQTTDKSIASFCIPGLFANIGHSSASYLLKKKSKAS